MIIEGKNYPKERNKQQEKKHATNQKTLDNKSVKI